MGGLQAAHQNIIGDALKAGFQNFVDQSATRVATTATGAPAAGYFHSTIVGRAPIPDISNDLRASLGVERISVQQIVQLQNEFGASGQPVYSVLNDDRGLIRFIGNWSQIIDGYGMSIQSGSSTTTDLVEITFYGTGLNLLTSGISSATINVAIDGGGYTAYSLSGSSIISNRNYIDNKVVNIASTSVGVHTVRIAGADIGNAIRIAGFEILNANASGYININTGTSYIQGQKVLKNIISSIHYGKDSTNATTLLTNGKGGRIVRYLNQDGTVGQAFTAVDTNTNTLANATHANEEVVRKYIPREFGAGRYNATYANEDDFSLMTNATRAAVFTLDDGTTTLYSGSAGLSPSPSVPSNPEALYIGSNSNYISFTFVGCGLDLVLYDSFAGTNGATDTQLFLDGSGPINWPYTSGNTGVRVQKIVSGLTYGTHTFKMLRNAATAFLPSIVSFIVYQPKKPVVPVTAIELCDYNVMADYNLATSIGTDGVVSSGTLRKMGTREVTYVGANWQTPSFNSGFACGFGIYSNAATNYAEYVFFGTGVNLRMNIGNTTYNFTYSIGVNGGTLSSNLSSYTSAFTYTGSGLTYNNATGTISGTSSGAVGTNGGIFSLSGLPLGVHKLRFTINNAQATYLDAIDVITPIHSHKSNIYSDLQNTLSVGSNSLADSRKTSAIKEIMPAQKAWAQAIGVYSAPSTATTSFTPLADMSLTVKTNGGNLKINYSVVVLNNTANAIVNTQIYVNGAAVGSIKRQWTGAGSTGGTISDELIVAASPGVHKIDIYWSVNTGTGYANLAERNLTVQEL